MAKPITFNHHEEPYCPNGCGLMSVAPSTPGPVSRETRARCGVCLHTMLVAVEGPVMAARTSAGRF